MAKESNEQGLLIPEGEYTTLVFKRTLPQSPERVWEAITNPEDLKEWLMCSVAKIDGRPGGTVEMVSGPGQYRSRGKILTWDPPRIFEYEWKVEPVSEMPHGEDAVFHFELTPQTDSTLLTVTYRRLTEHTALGFAPGVHALLDRLKAQLGGEELPDWTSRFTEVQSLYPSWKK